MSGRAATSGVIPGRFALSVGRPDLPEPQGWKWTPLVDVARLESGHTPSRKCPEYWGGGIPWIGIRDAGAHHGRTIFDTAEHITPEGVENSAARVLPTHTVCLSRTASVGYVTVMGRPMTTSQDFVNWVCGPGLLPEYLKYVLLAELDSLSQFSTGSTHQTIYFPEVKAFHALLPPTSTQRAIVEVLGALDDKIVLNRRTVETLEELTRAQFQHWLDESRSGWRELPLGEVVTMKRGYDLPLSARSEGLVPIISSAGVTGTHSEPRVKGPGVVTGRYGTLGDVYWSDVDFWPLNTTLYVDDFHGNDPWYVLHLLRGIDFGKYSDKAAVPGVNRNDLEREVIRVAPLTEQAAFRERSWPWKARTTGFERETRTLAELRDMLLTKLLSGALRVRDAEKIVGETTWKS